jgi:apolipoprotein N-acyltransferase
VTGAPRSAEGRRTNAIVSFDARGLRTSYDKQRLVPFSESDPEVVGFLAPLLEPVTAGDAYVPGDRATVFDGVAVPFAAPICFEITYPELIRGFRSAGAELLVNLSNDAWFGRTGYADMHFGHAVMRAVELRTWVVRGANTGISAVVDPAGRVLERLDVFETGTLRVTVYGAGPATLYARHGDTPVLTMLAACVLLGVGRAAQGRAMGRSPRS